MLKKEFGKGFLIIAVLCCNIICWWSAVSAEEEEEFTFDEIVVTATRTTKVIQDVPASISVVTARGN